MEPYLEEELLVQQAKIFLKVFTWNSKGNGPEMEFKPTVKNPSYITFNWEQNEITFCFGGGPRKMAHSEKANVLLLMKQTHE